MDQAQIARAVAEILAAVRSRGDEALIDFTRRWDGVSLTPETLRVPREVIESADTDNDFARAFRRACDRIRRFHEEVKPRTVMVEDEDGNRLGLRWTAVGGAGLYVPGGKASYPSTLAMTAIPAQIAGVARIVVVSPPGPDGEVSPQVLLGARILGIDEIYRVGGAQAVGALAWGTATIPRVDKIFGPGNAFVAEAKKQVFGDVGIDMLAGPSEVVVYADHTARPEWVAADLMAQAEHDEDTCCTFLASAPDVLEAVRRVIAAGIETQPRREVIERSFAANGTFTAVESAEEAARRINEIAPEHLSIQIEDPWGFLPRVRNAGSIFLGHQSAVAIGDYYAGTNHVLPTGRTARFASCLSVEDFMKRSNVAQVSGMFVREHGGDVEVLAAGERLAAHERSVAIRRSPATRAARPGIDAVEAYHLVEEEGEVKLNQNESPWDIPDELKSAIFDRMRALPWNRYHQKLPEELRAAIARHVGLEANRVFVGNGSNLILQWVFEAFGGPGRLALIPSPSFSLFRMWGRISETALEEFRLRPGAAGLEYPVDDIVSAIERRRPDLVVLNLPNNPTGSELGRRDLESVVAAAGRAGAWVVIDEAYREFSDSDRDAVGLVRDGRPVLVLRTFSKALSAAGLRIGYVLAAGRAADALSKIVPPFHTSLFNAVAGLVLLERRDHFQDQIERLKRERRRLMEELGALDGVEVQRSSANFFLFRVPDAEGLRAALARRGILVRALAHDAMLDGCLRVNVGTPQENDRFLEATRQILRR